jgi:ComF family protein
MDIINMTVPVFVSRLLPDLLDLLLPRICCCCRRALHRWEDEICSYCLIELPLTHFEDDPENLLAQVFWGRVYLEQAVSWFFFHKESRYQKAIHQLKYVNRPGIGRVLGSEFGYQLLRSEEFILPDLLIPVPLHLKKKKKRGYNQSEMIAGGMSDALGIPMVNSVLQKAEKTSSQTNKSRFDRYLNVANSFSVEGAEVIEGKHIFLIDDVLTTGATLEACASKLLETPSVKISVGTLAWTRD